MIDRIKLPTLGSWLTLCMHVWTVPMYVNVLYVLSLALEAFLTSIQAVNNNEELGAILKSIQALSHSQHTAITAITAITMTR